jgi:acyl-CoA thioester hydrolase
MENAFTIPIQTRMTDYDVLGHINNVAYINFMEIARVTTFKEELKVDLTQYSGLTARTEVEYLKPAKWGTAIAVIMGVSDLGAKHIDLDLQVVNADDHSQVFAQAKICQVTFDIKAGKACHHPEELREQLDSLMGETAAA